MNITTNKPQKYKLKIIIDIHFPLKHSSEYLNCLDYSNIRWGISIELYTLLQIPGSNKYFLFYSKKK